MQQIIQFLARNSYRLVFLLLFSFGFYLIIRSHYYQLSKVLNSANWVVGSVHQTTSDVKGYLKLKEENSRLLKENSLLRKELINYNYLKYRYLNSSSKFPFRVISAHVIKNSFLKKTNFLTLNVGQVDSVTVDMGVFNDRGIVGIVVDHSEDFSIVQSVLNTKSKIHAKIKNSNHFGTLRWDGVNTGYVQLKDLPRLANVFKGDTIVTGASSYIFPENLPIGYIKEIDIDEQTNYYNIQVSLFNDMTNLGAVYLTKNDLRDQKNKLEKNEGQLSQ